MTTTETKGRTPTPLQKRACQIYIECSAGGPNNAELCLVAIGSISGALKWRAGRPLVDPARSVHLKALAIARGELDANWKKTARDEIEALRARGECSAADIRIVNGVARSAKREELGYIRPIIARLMQCPEMSAELGLTAA